MEAEAQEMPGLRGKELKKIPCIISACNSWLSSRVHIIDPALITLVIVAKRSLRLSSCLNNVFERLKGSTHMNNPAQTQLSSCADSHADHGEIDLRFLPMLPAILCKLTRVAKQWATKRDGKHSSRL